MKLQANDPRLKRTFSQIRDSLGGVDLDTVRGSAKMLDLIVQVPAVRQQWLKYAEKLSSPATQKFIIDGITKAVGPEAGPLLGKFGAGILKQLGSSKGGFGAAVKYAERAAPKLLEKLGGLAGLSKLLGKVSKLVPFAGLAIGLINAVKTFSDPNATFLQKLGAVVDVAAGAAAVIPGVGTGVAAALNTASLALTAVNTVSSVGGGRASQESDAYAQRPTLDIEALISPPPNFLPKTSEDSTLGDEIRRKRPRY